MPQLANPRWEAYARNTIEGLKHGWSQAEIYRRSGYRATDRSANALGCNLLKNVSIQARIAEISQPAIRKTQVSLENLLDRLETNIEAAAAEKQHGAVNGSLRLMAELRGMLIQRTEIGGPGEFSGIETIADVADAMLREMDAATALEAIDAVRARIELQAANQAADVSPVYRRQDETAAALKTLRNGRRR